MGSAATRQSLCFSATTPPELTAVLGVALKRGHTAIDCVGKEDADTHAAVDQAAAVVPLEQQMGACLTWRCTRVRCCML